jgi:hypothetical protein
LFGQTPVNSNSINKVSSWVSSATVWKIQTKLHCSYDINSTHVLGKPILGHFAQQFGDYSNSKFYYSHDINPYGACVLKDGKTSASWKKDMIELKKWEK